MELLLQKDLPHQQAAVEAVCGVFEGVRFQPPVRFYENPLLDLHDARISANVEAIQQRLVPEHRGFHPVSGYLNLDVKMETGTGKTYVCAKIIHELHQKHGVNKFILVVPSLPVKAGSAQFLQDDYVRRHFSDSCGYGSEIELGVLEAIKGQKKGRSYFPSVVSDFIKGSCQSTKKIYVLLVNMALLTNNQKRNGKDVGTLWRNDYDYGAEGFYRPYDALRATKPFVLIDEPHRFARDQKAFLAITEEIKPQCIIRLGATFPDTASGKGKGKTAAKDYQNLLYDLDACKSFNQGLIKGVAKEHFEPISKKEEKVKITSIESKERVHFLLKKKDGPPKSYTLGKGDSLSIISDALEGITISAIGKASIEFSNGLIKSTGEELDVDIYMTSYQEQMLRLALKRHFEIEKKNFCDRTFKIKTLALFFIDDITSYRRDKDGKAPYLLTAFERLLKEQIEKTAAELTAYEAEYRAYLEASLANISGCHAGYFSQDNDDSDEKIAEEVNDILHGKKKLLSFRNDDGSYNVRRFLFSKWTLKEGWDNPNVFTIAKLRSSGSEISKLQEVGRGLRLPVDENGNRIANEEFTLNYIVDFTEADFAEKLIEQINGENPHAVTISEEKLEAVSKKLGISADELFDDLYNKHYIDRHYTIRQETRHAFFSEYPDFNAGLSEGKVRDRNREKAKTVKIRWAVYEELKELWEAINRHYLIFYDADLNTALREELHTLFEKDVFVDLTASSRREIVQSDGEQMTLGSETGVQYSINRPLPYHVFLKRISGATGVPVVDLHSALCTYAQKHGTIAPPFFNESSVVAFCRKFAEWKLKKLAGKFHYRASSAPVKATALTHEDGTPLSEIAQGRIGVKSVEGTPRKNYLYDVYTYDSPLEKDNLLAEIDEVIAYGKIPRNSVAIPTIMGGTFSPDFLYAIKRKDGRKVLNVVVETKDAEEESDLRETEKMKIMCAEVFFNTLAMDGYKVKFRTQIGNTHMKQIIQEVLSKESSENAGGNPAPIEKKPS